MASDGRDLRNGAAGQRHPRHGGTAEVVKGEGGYPGTPAGAPFDLPSRHVFYFVLSKTPRTQMLNCVGRFT